jgi:large repetitive protein
MTMATGFPTAPRLGTSQLDPDSDDDGLGDGREDRNRKGRRGRNETDPDRFDTDRDGLSDGLELGVRRRIADPRGRVAGAGKRFRRDLEPRTRTRPLHADSDGGGVSDGEDDTNHNGRRDPGETNLRKAGR